MLALAGGATAVFKSYPGYPNPRDRMEVHNHVAFLGVGMNSSMDIQIAVADSPLSSIQTPQDQVFLTDPATLQRTIEAKRDGYGVIVSSTGYQPFDIMSRLRLYSPFDLV